jgi:predicted NBD/HSP70 family sugar kinase
MEPKRTTGRDIRRKNRSALLSELFFHGPLSRLELAGRTGLSPATASNVTADLIDDRIIVEAGRVESDGGRPRVLLRVDPHYGYVVGAVVSETDVRVELFDLSMTSLGAVVSAMPPGPADPETVTGLVAAGVAAVVSAAGLSPDRVLGVGLAVPGLVEQGFTPLVHRQTIGWDGVPLARMLQRAGLDRPVFVENDAKTLGQAEMWFGAGRGAGHAVILLVGSGVGAAIVTGGAAHQGVTSSAGEWGHTTMVFGGRDCRCGAKGCLEAYVGAQGVLDRYRRIRRGRDVPGADEQSQLRSLIEAARTPGAPAELLAETADLLGAGIGDLINLINPERVIIGGWAGLALGEHLLPQIRESAGRHALLLPYSQATIGLGSLGEGAVTLGAATLPVATLLAGPSVTPHPPRTAPERVSVESLDNPPDRVPVDVS